MKTTKASRAASALTVGVVGCLVACGGADAPKAWSSLATCLTGPAVTAPVAERVQKLRSAQLASVGAKSKDAWPARCAEHANALFAATEDNPLIQRTMKERLACHDHGNCAFVADDAFVPTAIAVWDAAQGAKMKAEPVAGMVAPALSPPPLADSAGWKSFSKEPARVIGPALKPDGSAVLLLAPKEGKGRPRFCKLPAGFASIQCTDANASVPELAGQSIALARDTRGVFAAGLASEEGGLSAYNLETGARSDVHGKLPNLVSDGVAIETPAEPPPDPKAKAKPAKAAPDPKAAPAGFVAVEIARGKASKETKLAITPVGAPIGLGSQIAYVSGDGPSAALEVKGFSGGRLGGGTSIKGPFVGPFHTCTLDNRTAVATFDGHASQSSAKATGGENKTQFAIAFRTGDSWSKAQAATLPFDRALESDLVCTKTGASVAWVRRTAETVEVGRLDCTADGCKPQTVSLSGIESKWWGGVAPLGDKVLVFWRSKLGETRLRVGSLTELAQATDQLLFDSSDYGGPVAGEPMQASTETASLFVFNQESPVALRIGADGRATLLGS